MQHRRGESSRPRRLNRPFPLQTRVLQLDARVLIPQHREIVCGKNMMLRLLCAVLCLLSVSAFAPARAGRSIFALSAKEKAEVRARKYARR